MQPREREARRSICISPANSSTRFSPLALGKPTTMTKPTWPCESPNTANKVGRGQYVWPRPSPSSISFANVLLVQFGVKSRRSGVTRNRAQVGVDREEIAVGHVRIYRPWHHLKKVSIERKRQAVVRHAGTGTARVNVIEILAVPDDLYELLKRMPSLRPPRLIRRQVSRVEMRNATGAAWERPEIIASCEVM